MTDKEPDNWLEAVRQYMPWTDAKTAEVVKIEAGVSVLASPAEMLQALDEYMSMKGIKKIKRKDTDG